MLQRGILLSLLWVVCQGRIIDSKSFYYTQPKAEWLPIPTSLIGAAPADWGKFPFLVFIPFSTYNCTGSIINPSWILTAGHCFNTNETASHIIAGPIFSNELRQQISIVKALIHPEFSSDLTTGIRNDLTLVKLEHPLRFNEYVSSIKLPEKDDPWTGVGMVAAWGKINYDQYPIVPHHARFFAQDVNTCRRKMTEIRQENITWIPDNSLCYVPLNDRHKDSCNGDSGGPLIADFNHQNQRIVGVISIGSTYCGQIGFPFTVFVKVSSYIDWIQETMKD